MVHTKVRYIGNRFLNQEFLKVKFNREEILHVAHLARLNLSEEEIEGYQGQLNDILGYISDLENVEASGVQPTTHVHRLSNAFREDKTSPFISRKEALSNAPKEEEGSFVVPRIL